MSAKVSWSLVAAVVALAAVLPGAVSAQDAPAAAPDAGVAAPDEAPAPRKRRRRKSEAVAAAESPAAGDVPGRYAVVRDKRDTGCMVTLDRAKAKSGSRAQLAPGCRDQGIVVFDPSSWQIVKGTLVLTARAGHKALLQKQAEGVWKKESKEGKPLGLKKL